MSTHAPSGSVLEAAPTFASRRHGSDVTGREWFRSAPPSAVGAAASPYASDVALDGAGIPLVVRAALRASA
jgi:hypothetical protein